MLGCINIKDVGLEAATVQRVRNSSLAERPSAEDLTGLKCITEFMEYMIWIHILVDERLIRSEVRAWALMDRIKVRMPVWVTNESENLSSRLSKVSWTRVVLPGLVGA